MPYKSKAQAAFMHINHPEIASRWDKEHKEHPPGTLPEHVKGSKFADKDEKESKPVKGLKHAKPK